MACSMSGIASSIIPKRSCTCQSRLMRKPRCDFDASTVSQRKFGLKVPSIFLLEVRDHVDYLVIAKEIWAVYICRHPAFSVGLILINLHFAPDADHNMLFYNRYESRDFLVYCWAIPSSKNTLRRVRGVSVIDFEIWNRWLSSSSLFHSVKVTQLP